MMGSIPLRHQLFLPRGMACREENARGDDDDGHAVGFAPLVEWFEARVQVDICPLSATPPVGEEESTRSSLETLCILRMACEQS